MTEKEIDDCRPIAVCPYIVTASELCCGSHCQVERGVAVLWGVRAGRKTFRCCGEHCGCHIYIRNVDRNVVKYCRAGLNLKRRFNELFNSHKRLRPSFDYVKRRSARIRIFCTRCSEHPVWTATYAVQ